MRSTGRRIGEDHVKVAADAAQIEAGVALTSRWV